MGSRARQRPAEDAKAWLRYLPHAFALPAIAAAVAHFRTQIDSNDEGIATMGAWRILRGEVPYRDFFAIETPLSFYLVAPLYALFGVSFTVGRVVTQILGIGLVLSVFRLARRWIPSPAFDPPAPGRPDEWKDYLVGRYRMEWANEGWGLWKRSAE